MFGYRSLYPSSSNYTEWGKGRGAIGGTAKCCCQLPMKLSKPPKFKEGLAHLESPKGMGEVQYKGI
jgi:hypothetical protein